MDLCDNLVVVCNEDKLSQVLSYQWICYTGYTLPCMVEVLFPYCSLQNIKKFFRPLPCQNVIPFIRSQGITINLPAFVPYKRTLKLLGQTFCCWFAQFLNFNFNNIPNL